ncbi:hypothetical protein HF576_10720 [Microbacterium sp. CFH 90308]|uniref:Sugar lactone lactonase YvrE n=1 Tax=Microbacterium salsuginis TaxID=2722803 RepID=A0ABX1KD86_9MICO|nr:hypothetical protein [Microbacterium sp. CFH 90308]NLP84325.1 hypothetical protein [Microbacterium sp. CFH 90308]
MTIATLERFSLSSPLTQLLDTATANGLSNIFNPSITTHRDATLIAFRAESFPGERPFRAYLMISTRDSVSLIDLTAASASVGIPKTADPKLVNLGSSVYVTFNTGHVHTGQNDIYLQKVFPELAAPQRCALGHRRDVEKNWGFFIGTDGTLGALYSLSPLNILRLTTGELGSDDQLHFEMLTDAPLAKRFPNIHIGSQPIILPNGHAIVVANQQRPIPGLRRKFYFGRLVEVDLAGGSIAQLSPARLIHSWTSMRPQWRRHNPNLISATYFSGLSVAGDSFILSYGINDKRPGLAHVPIDYAWGA